MGMFGRFSKRAETAMNLAFDLAKELNHPYIATEHLLYGIVAEGEGIGAKAVLDEGIDSEIIKKDIIAIVGKGKEPVEVSEPTPRTKRAFELAVGAARELGNNYIGSEHLLLGILEEGEGIGVGILKGRGVRIDELGRKLVQLIQGSRNVGQGGPSNQESSTPYLDEYCKNLNEIAKREKIDPVIGRDKEINRIIQVLSRRTKNNPVLIGEPGVGKTAIAEGLAQKIVLGEVPQIVKGKKIYSLDIAGMLAGAKYRGEFEERLKNVMEELAENDDIILFIDEFHTIVGAGAAEGAIDASNILKPALARGDFQVIGATTIDEYRKSIEKDAALERRLQPIMVDEPSVEDTITILEGIRDKYEAHHKVKITDDAIYSAAELSHRYIADRFLPDKAIDLIDEAASKIRIESFIGDDQNEELEKRLEKLAREKEEAINNQKYERAAEIRDEEKSIKEKLVDLKKNESRPSDSSLAVRSEDIAAIVSEWTGIPVKEMTEEEGEQLINLEEKLHQDVIGQEQAVISLSKAVRRARVGLKDPNKPVGSFIFVGPTGVGKTHLAKALAKELFKDENAMIRVDMSEYMEKHSVSKLVGSPPGYVGFDDGGQLTEAVRRKPYSVILFDEIEKAHPDVFNILLQILDDGRLTDSKGRTVDFKNTIIILTSNVGARDIKKQNVLGFSVGGEEDKKEYEKMKEVIEEELKRAFRPEFLNRIDETIVFHSLSKEDTREIVNLLIKDLNERLDYLDLELDVSDQVKDYIVDVGYDEEYGARPLERTIRSLIEDELAEKFLKGQIARGDLIRLELNSDKEIIFKRAD